MFHAPRRALLGLVTLAAACSAPSDADAPAAHASAADTTLATEVEPNANESAPAAPAEASMDAPEPAAVDPGRATADGLAPTPYTAAEIRAANPDGTEIVLEVTTPNGPAMRQVMHFDHGDAEGVTVSSWSETPDGDAAPGQRSDRSTWEALRLHAAFDADALTVSEDTVEVGAGTFDCWIYEVANGPSSLQRFCFAKERAGPPVLMEVLVGGESLSRMELVAVR